MFHHLINLLANVSSAFEVTVVAKVAACSAGSVALKAHSIFEFAGHGVVLFSDFLHSNG